MSIKNKIIKICLIVFIIILVVAFICFAVKKYKNTNLENNNEIIENNNEKTDEEENEENNEQLKEEYSDYIFGEYYAQAKEMVEKMSLDEKIGQMLLVRYPENDAVEILKNYKFCGYTFYEKDFKGKAKDEVIENIKELQNNSEIPLLIAVDEEGGIVVRVSSNKNLASERFKSAMELYKTGGFDLIKQDTIQKSKTLKDLGINLNLAPVVDVSTNPTDYMYKRTLGEGTELVAEYAKVVIEASKDTGVSYTLKHFPGYGNNQDTHKGESIDGKTYDDILKYDLPPFISGIEAGAEAVLISHNTVTSIDQDNPASLSKNINNVLRDELGFTGIIITDDLDMGATSSIPDSTSKAILAGNDIIITTNYINSIESIKKSLETGEIDLSIIDEHVTRIIAWKYYKKLL